MEKTEVPVADCYWKVSDIHISRIREVMKAAIIFAGGLIRIPSGKENELDIILEERVEDYSRTDSKKSFWAFSSFQGREIHKNFFAEDGLEELKKQAPRIMRGLANLFETAASRLER